MFQFRGFPTYTYWFSIRSMVLHHGCSHIRISADRSLFAAPRSFSQLVASFFGSWCQGIHLALLFAWTIVFVPAVLSLELLEFHKQIIFCFGFLFSEKVLSFSEFVLIPPFGEIVVITQIGKTLIDLTNLVKSIIVLLSVRFLLLHLYSVFNEHNSLSTFLSTGGLKWTRTTDLALIRRAL